MTKPAALWSKTLRLGDQSLDLETGRIARQADGALLLRSGRTVMLVTAASRSEPSRHLGFFPLTVEYREKMAGAGRIPGGFLRREGRLGAHEVLGSRLVDRSIRPHFPEGFRCETQVLASVLSFDPLSDPEVLAITGASAALHVSEIPWKGPVAGVRVVRVAGEIRAFPSFEERQAADLDLLVSFSPQGLVMIEGNAAEVSEEILLTALEAARQAADPLLEAQEELRRAAGTPKREFAPPRAEAELVEKIRALLLPRVDELFGPQEKRARGRLKDDLLRSVEEGLAAEEADVAAEGERGQRDGDSATQPPLGPDETAPPPLGPDEIAPPRLGAREIAEDVLRQEIRRRALAGQRLDGRGPKEIRAISGEVAWLPGAHGSSVFTRGETQALVTCTLGSERDEQLIEDLHGLHKERFLLHYKFPPYSVGEVRPLRVPGRREIGHGQLARRAIRPVLPESEEFPYTIRVESEIASSNGSSSMATVCGATLAMMDAGVTLRRPVAGIAMGLIADGEQSVILSDILGDEDHLGDMDFKVAGTEAGITVVQLDNKVGSLSQEVLESALGQAREGRLHILHEMSNICPAYRDEVPAHAPRVVFRQIRPARIRDLIGPGGRHIQEVQVNTGVKVDVGDDGRVRIFGPAGAKIREAEQRIAYLTGEPEVGKIYRGQVSGVTDFGCFVQIFHGIEGLVHVSDLDRERVEHPSEVAVMGEEMVVKVLGVSQDGKLRLSRKEALDASQTDIEG